MGQTLSHGVYLPAEGERNCYSGLASNWNLLDTAIGDTAGKASATHTHGNITNDGRVGTTANLPLITGTGGAIQAGAFGNQANTFCEGNDSRLSDARTPVAHTHSKSDVTDLLNSNFIPSANNSYDLGSSSYQWNNLYAKNYYYNGTAFTDKFVTTDTAQTISVEKKFTVGFSLKNTAVTSHTTAPSSETNAHFLFLDGNDRYWGSYAFYWLTDGTTETRLQHTNYFTSGDQGWWQLAFGATKDFNNVYFKPLSNATINLGTSTNKWKTLNGINPGALSLPGTGGYTDIKGDITNLSGGDNTFTAPYDGWVCVKSTNATIIHIINTNWAVCQSATRSTAGTLCCLCPVMSGQSFKVIVNATSLEYAYIHPCKGNV